MAAFILRPWPFEKNEEVELYWLCSPYMNKHREWRIKAILKYYNTIKTVELPWGTLPYLRLGQKYRDGIAIDSYKRGSLGEVKINDEVFEICNSFDMPPKLFYLYKNYEYGMQKTCKYTVEDITYYVPCIEVLRSFFAKSKTLTNYILKPNGLDFLINKSEITNDCLNIALSVDIPERIANNETAVHLGWIKYNHEAYKSWTSVYGNIFDNESVNSKHIQLLPPVRQDCEWKYRGIKSGSSVLILELMSSTGLRTPFKYVMFTHPKIFRNKVTEVSEKIRTTEVKDAKVFEMADGKDGTGTRKQQNQSALKLSSTQFIFEDIIKIQKITKKERETFIGTKIIPKVGTSSGNNEENTIKVSTEDWSGEGKIDPIEFKSLEVVKGKTGKGLEEFYKIIQYIMDYCNEYKISMTEVFLPEGKSFSYYPDGDRRNCAIVKIENKDLGTYYILEIGRADKWRISTLLMRAKSNGFVRDNSLECIINILFSILINNGHWNNYFLQNQEEYEFYTIKHIHNQAIEKWIQKIFNRL